jgi:hypothetical protein
MKKMKLTRSDWSSIHRDFKGTIDGYKSRMWNNELIPVEIVKDYDYKQGDRVRCNGYDGAIVRRYSAGMYEVRVPGGVTCVSASELVAL